MYKWTFDIDSPTGNYMRELSSMPDKDIWISEQSNDFTHWFMFSSIHLNQLDDPCKVYERAFKLKMLVDGISYLIHENKKNYQQIVLGKLYNENDESIHFDRQINSYVFDFSFQTEVTNEDYKNNAISHLIHLASVDNFIQNILLICSQGMGFNSLYQALDETKNFLKSRRAKLEKLGIDSGQLKRFTHTVNNFEALGIDARHGTLGQESPNSPISLQDAHALITQILKIVFQKFYSIDLPIIEEKKFSIDDLF